ncbi:outer membrane protein assembly factor BamD [Candidatus Ishikawella capsulata]|nr:outer membrane protein assembly factor BamD [Candidatus Ishikawaella capsulata]
MIRIKNLIIKTFFFITIMGCSVVKNTLPNEFFFRNKDSYDEGYIMMLQTLSRKYYEDAIQGLNVLNITCLPVLANYYQQLELDLIYAYYKSNQFNQAEKRIITFMQSYPKHPNIDYVLYLKGVINMIKSQPIKDTECDQNPNKIAYESFNQLILNHPNSFYAKDAYKRLIFIKNYLARHEYAIVRFYYDQKNYISVINRVEQMLRDYSDTQATRDALFFMKDSCKRLNLNTKLKEIDQIIEINHLIRPIRRPIKEYLYQFKLKAM